MYIAMNRFKVIKEQAKPFEDVWLTRVSRLDEMPGFVVFNLLKGPEAEDHILYVSHTIWASEAAFTAWTKSEQFRAAHARAEGGTPRVMGHPQFEGFEVVQTIENPKQKAAE